MYAQWYEGVDEVKTRLAELGPLAKISGAKTFERQAATVARILEQWPNHRNPRPVKIGKDGSLFEIDGRQIEIPGLETESILRSIEDTKAGRYRPLKDILAERRVNEI
jgi:hypothetical protein